PCANVPGGCLADLPDADRDGLHDDLELRFGSDPELGDTDGDGLSDLDEYAGDLWGSTDPRRSDTDGDGRPDGADAEPRLAAQTEILRATPTLDGVLSASDGWTELFQRPTRVRWNELERTDSAPVRVLAAWAADDLYLAFQSTPRIDGAWLDLDAVGSNTMWLGGDRYKLVYSPAGAWPAPRAGTTVEIPSSYTLATRHGLGSDVVELAIPRDLGAGSGRQGKGFLPDPGARLDLVDGGVIGLNLEVRLPDAWATFTRSQHQFLPLKLRTTAAPTAAITVAGIDVDPAGAATFTLEADRPTHASVCVS